MIWLLGCTPELVLEPVPPLEDPPATAATDPIDSPPETTPVDTAIEPSSCGEPFDPLPAYDPDGELLCEIPDGWVDGGGDPANPPCALGGGGSSDADPTVVPDVLSVATWNVEFGAHQAEVIAALTTALDVDFLLLQEVARHDLESDPPGIDQVEELALATGMYYAYGVEWDRRENPETGGEHGVAILSRYPIGNAVLLRLPQLNDWWAEDQLYGGRVALAADVLVGCTRLRLYAMHLDTRGLGDDGRAEQGEVVRLDADESPTVFQIAGGDWNTWNCNPLVQTCNQPPQAEQVVEDYLADGWIDTVPADGGWTQLGEGFFPQRLDWLFHRGGLVPIEGEVGRDVGGSDHVPIVFRFAIPPSVP